MNYPVWELTWAGGGLLVAIIAVIHVYVAHFAVGGGLFLVLTETKAHRENNPALLDYVRRHTKFFLLLTMVLGGLSGVGIWLIISLLSPGATSVLIHTFVFAWATEWVCFMVEIISLLIYYYTFNRMEPKSHLMVGWVYFIAAWLSLFFIGGIIAFMLTPGEWLKTGDFWDAFFNPSFWPSIAFRTSLTLVFAGVYGLVTASWLKDAALRQNLMRYCALWLAAPLVLVMLSGWWYLGSIPAQAEAMILGLSPRVLEYFQAFIWITPVLFAGGLIMALRLPKEAQRVIALCLLVVGLLYMGSFETVRESGRRPYIIYNHMYSDSVFTSQTAELEEKGVLASARWVQHKEISDENRLAAGKELYNLLCISCHATGGPMNDLLPLTAKYGLFGMESQLTGMGKLLAYMPRFWGNAEERQALAAYIVEGLHGKKEEPKKQIEITQIENTIPPFDREKDEYLLLAWNDLGMHCISDSSNMFLILPPANTLNAILIRRGELPERVSEGVEITYKAEPGFQDPASQVCFWKYAKALFGVDLEPNVGLAGKGMAGTMDFKAELDAFEAALIPVVPYTDDGKSFNPFPLFFIEAREKESGELLASTQVVAPTSTEMGCLNCHGGKWRFEGRAGVDPATAGDILATHDLHNHTDLAARAKAGKPVLCASCHADPALGAKGDGKRLNLSSAMHGWHANYLSDRGVEACSSCHPSSPEGATRCMRGLHADMDLNCTNCHGFIEDHALGLLKHEQEAGKPAAEALMRYLKPRTVETVAQVNPRGPWLNEPDCLNCHVDFNAPEPGATGFNRWTAGAAGLYRMRGGEGGVKCEACHGSTHALYPAHNPYGKDRDVIQPLQYQKDKLPIAGDKKCWVCHTVDMVDEMHHANILREPRAISAD